LISSSTSGASLTLSFVLKSSDDPSFLFHHVNNDKNLSSAIYRSLSIASILQESMRGLPEFDLSGKVFVGTYTPAIP